MSSTIGDGNVGWGDRRPLPSNPLRQYFLLEPEVIYLNHGSFGACPKPVFEAQQAWQRRLEREPVQLLLREIQGLMADARRALGAFVGAPADDLVFFPNPTTALNMVARNLMRRGTPYSLKPGDEILTTDHEYGALMRMWRYVCKHTGARLVPVSIPLPVSSKEAWVERIWSHVTSRTRVLFVSHITSPTALIFPVASLCQRARDAGILTIVDGAHAPGHIPLHISTLGADVYAGALHKWLMAPKGAAFLYAHPRIQPWLDPLVVSWGYEADPPGPSQFIDYHEWQGTRDMSPFLTVPSAIRFQEEHQWDRVRARCHDLAVETRARIHALTGQPVMAPADWVGQMAAAMLPSDRDPNVLQQRLWEQFRIEAPVYRWQDHVLIRVSFQGYNDEKDAEALLHALSALLATG